MTRIVTQSQESIIIRGKPVPKWFVDERGYRYVFDSMAILDKDDCFELSSLDSNQCIIAPGAIYTTPNIKAA